MMHVNECRNCGQCKEMYGVYFDGQRCAEFCLASKGALVPDCNVPDTLDKYLKTLQLQQLQQSKASGDDQLQQSTAYRSDRYRPSANVWRKRKTRADSEFVHATRWYMI